MKKLQYSLNLLALVSLIGNNVAYQHLVPPVDTALYCKAEPREDNEFVKQIKDYTLNSEYNKIIDEGKALEQKRIKEEAERLIREAEAKKKQQEEELSRSMQKPRYRVKITYYTNDCHDCGKADSIGANGKRMESGMGAFPKQFPFGTKMFIDGIGVLECQDRGGAIKILNDGTIVVDVFIPNASQRYINKLGVKYTTGYLID